jgi:hypothetical protein
MGTGPGMTPPKSARPHTSGSREPPARGEEFRSLPRRARWPNCRRREMARLAVEPALAPGWGLSLSGYAAPAGLTPGVGRTSPARRRAPGR